MTLVRRVTALEATLTPTQLVLRWLAEAHSHGSLTAYVAAMRINTTTHELIDKQGLVDAVLCGHLAMLANEPPPGAVAGRRGLVDQLGSSRDLALRRVVELHATQEARALVESRYLDGHPALFPDGLQGWEGQVAATERLAVMADRLAELDGAARPSLDMPDAIAARVPAVVADLVEPAKVAALEKLGAGDRAIRIGTSWVRGRAPQAVP